MRHLGGEAKESVVKCDVLERGGHWKVSLFERFSGDRPPLLPQSSFIYTQLVFQGYSLSKMLRLALRVRPSARLTRPSVLSGPAASPRSGPVSCQHLKRYHSNGPTRIRGLCHGRRLYNSILTNRSAVSHSQTAAFSQSVRVYSLPPHQKVREAKLTVALLHGHLDQIFET